MNEIKTTVLINGKIKEIIYNKKELSTYDKEFLKSLNKETDKNEQEYYNC